MIVTSTTKTKVISKKTAGLPRIIIESVSPQVDGGQYPVKRVVGEKVIVQADIFTEGHNYIMAHLLYRKDSERAWQKVPMRFLENDRWEGVFRVESLETYHYTIQAWVDHFKTWQKSLLKKFEQVEDIRPDLQFGLEFLEKLIQHKKDRSIPQIQEFIKNIRAQKNINESIRLALSDQLLYLVRQFPDKNTFMTYHKTLTVAVDRDKAGFSSWYEFFPRSCGFNGKHGTIKDCEMFLPEISRMGFDVIYLPPVHPIGQTKRKGKNNASSANAEDCGSPWAIGGKEGGHKSIHPQLGTLEDFKHFVRMANNFGIEIAMDLAFQCSPDHPYVKKYPDWFKRRPDGSFQCLEDPPLKYEDVLPFNFETADWQNLWLELKSIVVFWIKQDIKIFRVDSPHTKPFAFWKWLIGEIKKEYPDVLFLSADFTRSKVMQQLAKLGFSQSYTYFTWRTTKWELVQYLNELSQPPLRDYYRPNFWPNTPDILPFNLQHGGRPTFISRFMLAATLSSNYGIYGPAYELCVSAALEGKEEYYNSEKYEIKIWDRNQAGNLKDLIAQINKIRRENPAFQASWNVKFCDVDNVNLISYYRATEDLSNIVLMVVNLDSFHIQSGWVRIPLNKLGINFEQPYKMSDLITGEEYLWQGEWNYVELNPYTLPVHIFKVQKL